MAQVDSTRAALESLRGALDNAKVRIQDDFDAKTAERDALDQLAKDLQAEIDRLVADNANDITQETMDSLTGMVTDLQAMVDAIDLTPPPVIEEPPVEPPVEEPPVEEPPVEPTP